VVERGTASYYHDLEAEIGRPAAGKTGTSNEFIDAWFIGYIPQLSTSVWVGYPDERRSMVNINGLPEINGENYPLDIWSLYMQSAVQRFPVQAFDEPSPDLNLEVKTDDRAYVKPPPPPEPPPEETTEETTDESDAESDDESDDESAEESDEETTTTATTDETTAASPAPDSPLVQPAESEPPRAQRAPQRLQPQQGRPSAGRPLAGGAGPAGAPARPVRPRR
jgi:penicillin-binding protein 1A